MRHSLYWDDFSRRVVETADCIKTGKPIPVRRVAVFITDKCNFKCAYCNVHQQPDTLTYDQFVNVLNKYGKTALIHITGGEPSTVPWLYDLLYSLDGYRINLNTNAYVKPPTNTIGRLKVSLDHYNADYWNHLVGIPGAFEKVVKNIQLASQDTSVSVTYTLTRENYRDAVPFARFAREMFPDIYAVFFSVYKGTNRRFAMSNVDSDRFFDDILPYLLDVLDDESRNLLQETMDEKRRIIQGIRFPENKPMDKCYISMSERVISPQGKESSCSHLYRDGVWNKENTKDNSCLYGCNRRLVAFNEEVERRIYEKV